MTRSSAIRAGLAQRARIVLLAADGLPNAQIARRTGTSRPTVVDWRARYDAGGIGALDDAKRSGRPPQIDEIAVVTATLSDDGHPPPGLGVTHWSARLLGAHLGISFASVARIWRKWDLQPWRAEAFTFSTDPELDAKIRDVVGLYLNPPEKAVVLCVDERSKVQALDRTAPILPGVPEKQTHDHIRHGTTTPFAALEVATGRGEQACMSRHRHQEFLRFLKQVAKACPRRKLHLVLDNYATHKHPCSQGVARAQPADHTALHPDLRVVAEHGRDLLRDHHPPGHPPRHLRLGARSHRRDHRVIDGWTERCTPFVWTEDADTIISKAHRQSTSNTRHYP